ncbi:hypothetical protein QBK99_03365 [Corticibacterium sp. UT-5YL-CI-8]|nr:hypothetical protein [Tianweitania sp. UT-5YL-CI-8]
MKVIFELSGTTLFEADMDIVPPSGSLVRFRTTTYKKGVNAGSLIEVLVGIEDPVRFEFDNEKVCTAYVSANGFRLLEEGQPND